MAFVKKDSKFKWDPSILREVIEKSGLSYQQVSNATEISIASLNAYMNRKRKTTYRLTNPIESARMKESLAESMGFS